MLKKEKQLKLILMYLTQYVQNIITPNIVQVKDSQ